MRLLVTRPLPDGERTAAALRARGHDVVVAPLMQIEATAAAIGGRNWAGIVFTSANAARALERHPACAALLACPVFAVGARTAEAARALGFREVASADGDAQDLLRLIEAYGARGPLLYLAGEERAADIAGALAQAGIAVETVAIYRTVKATALPAPAAAALRASALAGVLHFSRASAIVYLDCAKAAGLLDGALKPAQYCLSPQVAAPLAAAGAGRIAVAERPDEAALIDLIPWS